MKEVIINDCFGGFTLSEKAICEYAKRNGIELFKYEEKNNDGIYTKVSLDSKNNIYTVLLTKDFGETFNSNYDYIGDFMISDCDNKFRYDPIMIQVVKDLGSEEASGDCAKLRIASYDEEVYDCYISEYDGAETLKLEPFVNFDKIKDMKSTEIAEYLTSIGIKVKNLK